MLDKHERQMLHEAEREIDAAGPQRNRMWAVVAPLLLLVALLLDLGFPGSASIVTVVAAFVWLIRV